MSSTAFLEAQRLHMKGKVQDALRIYESLIKRDSSDVRARIFLALAYVQVGRPREALDAVNLAMKSQQSFKLIEFNTAGIVYRTLGRLPEAFQVLSRAAELAPDNGGILSNLGAIRMSQGMDEEAISYFDRAAQLLKEDVAPILNKARIRIKQKDYAEAELLLSQARDRHPGHPEIGLLTAQLALTEADHAAAFNGLAKTLEQQPANLAAWRDLNRIEPGAVDLAKLEAAAAAFASVKSTSSALIATVVGVLRKNWAWGSLGKIEGLLNEALLRGRDIHIESSAAFQLLAANVSQQAHKNASHASWSAAASHLAHLKRPAPELLEGRKLRVGILSSDLRNHAIGYLVVSTIEAHDKSRIEWIAYSNSPDDGGSIRERLRLVFDRFVNVASLNPAEIAATVRRDKIDVLVDLNGMTAETMVQAFLYKPAPVTVTWLGMPGSLGSGRDVDYVIVDPVVYDAKNRGGFDEKAVLLPHSYQPNDAIFPRKDPAITRERYGLPEDAFVFCSFNQHYKYSPDTVALWARILNANERSVLWILAPEPGSKPRVLDTFGRFNIPAERVIFAEKVPHGEHVQRIGLADLMLDNWPYNAHTTCSDALRAGTPIVTLPGDTFASRVAASILTFSDLQPWIAKSAADYARIAIDFSKSSRSTINEAKRLAFANYAKSAMVDSRTFARNLEEFYFAAFDRALKGAEPVHLRIQPNGVVVELDESELVQTPTPTRDESPKGVSVPPVREESPSLRSEAPAEGPDVAEARQLLALTGLRSPLVVDIGAADLDGQVGYEKYVDNAVLSVLGFEPSPEAFAALESKAKTGRRYLPIAVGDGGSWTLNLCAAPGMNSVRTPDLEHLSIFPLFAKWADVVGTLPVVTTRLDDVREADSAKFLKIDVQGFELTILKHAERLLQTLSVIQLELSPTPLYRQEESMFEVGAWLEQRGYALHHLNRLNKRGLKPFFDDRAPFAATNYLFQVDAVFLPSIKSWDTLAVERLEGIAVFMHLLYRSHDTAARALWTLDKRDAGHRYDDYRKLLKKPSA